MSKIKIILQGTVTRGEIDAILAAIHTYPIAVVNNYKADKSEVYTLELNDLYPTSIDSFYTVLDSASFLLEENASIWKFVQTGKTFNLENSFVRDILSTALPLKGLTAGTALKMRVEIPSFTENGFREIDLWYNQDFNPADVALLAEIGVVLTGNGAEFTIANDTECKVSFSKPTGVTDVYIIDFDKTNEIIAV